MEQNKKQKVRLWMSFFLSVIVLSVITGCGGNTKLTEEASPEPTAVEATATPKPKPKQTKKPKKKKEKPKETFDPFTVTKGDIEANFDEALKHVTICGKKLSFPFTLDDLGDEFDIDTEYGIYSGDEYVVDLTYRGKVVNQICIKDAKKRGDIRKKSIISFHIDIWNTPPIQFELCGVTLGMSKAYVNELWGVGRNDDWYYMRGGDEKSRKLIGVTYNLDEELTRVDIFYKDNQNKERGK